MNYGLGEVSRDLVKNVFLIIAAVLLAMILYQLLFGKKNSVLYTACYNMERAVANYYYAYCFYPLAHINDGVTESLGITVYDNANLKSSNPDSTTASSSVSTHQYHVTSSNWH